MNPNLPTYVLHILQGQWSNAQVLILFWIRWEKQNVLLSLVEDPTIWEQLLLSLFIYL